MNKIIAISILFISLNINGQNQQEHNFSGNLQLNHQTFQEDAIINAEERGSVNGTAPIRDLPILDSIESLQILVDNVPETDTISLVNVLKAIHVDVNISGLEIGKTGRSWDMLCMKEQPPTILLF